MSFKTIHTKKIGSLAPGREKDKLHTLDRFQSVILNLQLKLASAIESKQNKERIKANAHLIDELLTIYRDYDKLFFDSVEHRRRSGKAQAELTSLQMEAAKKIQALECEVEKLRKTLQWK